MQDRCQSEGFFSRRRTLALAAALLAFLAIVEGPAAIAAPEPEVVPRRWQLRVEPGDLRLCSIEVPGEGLKAFFYLTYKVTNTTGEDRYFSPTFEIVTEHQQPVRSGRNVPPAVVQTILARTGNALLQDEISVQGPLLQGPENAREGLVIWPADHLIAGGELHVFAGGFSGETKTVARPDNGAAVVLRKTLMLRYEALGILDPTDGRPLRRLGERWILR